MTGLVVLAIWAGLLLFRDRFWLADQRDTGPVPTPPRWPSVVAVIPARDEAATIGPVVTSLVRQAYPGPFRIILVDDGSSDGTADVARAAGDGRFAFDVVAGQPLPPGWTGKLWAVAQGIAAAGRPDYLLLTDADILHAPDVVRSLAARACADRLVLVSLMARLRCDAFAERMLVPAFVWFFQLLYPFRAVNRRGPVAAAAGGVMLVEREALAAAGGIAAVRGSIIDDCALGAVMKHRGAIRLLLTERAESLRPYPRVRDIGAMIARSAYAQLGYSPLALAGTLAGLALVFLVPPALALGTRGLDQTGGIAAWVLMTLAFQPMLRFYHRSPLWGVLLPLIASIYGWYTLVSAVQVWRGTGGRWKGRVQARIGA